MIERDELSRSSIVLPAGLTADTTSITVIASASSIAFGIDLRMQRVHTIGSTRLVTEGCRRPRSTHGTPTMIVSVSPERRCYNEESSKEFSRLSYEISKSSSGGGVFCCCCFGWLVSNESKHSFVSSFLSIFVRRLCRLLARYPDVHCSPDRMTLCFSMPPLRYLR